MTTTRKKCDRCGLPLAERQDIGTMDPGEDGGFCWSDPAVGGVICEQRDWPSEMDAMAAELAANVERLKQAKADCDRLWEENERWAARVEQAENEAARRLRERDEERAQIDALRGALGFRVGEGLGLEDIVAACHDIKLNNQLPAEAEGWKAVALERGQVLEAVEAALPERPPGLSIAGAIAKAIEDGRLEGRVEGYETACLRVAAHDPEHLGPLAALLRTRSPERTYSNVMAAPTPKPQGAGPDRLEVPMPASLWPTDDDADLVESAARNLDTARDFALEEGIFGGEEAEEDAEDCNLLRAPARFKVALGSYNGPSASPFEPGVWTLFVHVQGRAGDTGRRLGAELQTIIDQGIQARAILATEGFVNPDASLAALVTDMAADRRAALAACEGYRTSSAPQGGVHAIGLDSPAPLYHVLDALTEGVGLLLDGLGWDGFYSVDGSGDHNDSYFREAMRAGLAYLRGEEVTHETLATPAHPKAASAYTTPLARGSARRSPTLEAQNPDGARIGQLPCRVEDIETGAGLRTRIIIPLGGAEHSLTREDALWLYHDLGMAVGESMGPKLRAGPASPEMLEEYELPPWTPPGGPEPTIQPVSDTEELPSVTASMPKVGEDVVVTDAGEWPELLGKVCTLVEVSDPDDCTPHYNVKRGDIDAWVYAVRPASPGPREMGHG